MLRNAGLGFGTWALLDLLCRDRVACASRLSSSNSAQVESANPLAAKTPHFPTRAKHVIFLFMQGGPSHIDTFDPKPTLTQMHGKPLPASVAKGLQLQFTKNDAVILGSPPRRPPTTRWPPDARTSPPGRST